MKRIIVSCLLIMSAMSFAYSQAQFNLKGGLNFTQVSEDYQDGEIDGKAGFQIGFETRLGDQVYISPGIYYFQHQSRINFVDDGDVNIVDLPDYDVDFKGIRIPVHIGVDVIKGENWGLRAFTGPNASFILSTNDGLPGYEDDAFRDILWGYNAGVGVDLGIITLDVSREWRLNNVFEGNTPEFKNNITYLSVGFLF